jgi:hypothetical protein
MHFEIPHLSVLSELAAIGILLKLGPQWRACMFWWQAPEYFGDLADVLAHVNEAFISTAGPYTRACELCFHALNKLWNARARYDTTPRLADTPAFIALLKGMDSAADELLRDQRTKTLVDLTPHVMNHSVLKSRGYRPGQTISDVLRREASKEHRKLAALHAIYATTGADRDQVLKRLAEFLYVIRSNIAHGEKTSYGPDLAKASRDEAVSGVALPVLRLIIFLLLDRPDHKLLAYGTLAPGGQNESQLHGIEGAWMACVVLGRLEVRDGLAFLRPAIGGPPISAHLFRSSTLASHWGNLDAYEGARYRRTLVQADVAGVWEIASAYTSH